VSSGYGNVVEEAETQSIIRTSMMPWRSDQSKSVPSLTTSNQVDSVEDSTYCQKRHLTAFDAYHGVAEV
jgi:hypothetical protein